ncbi:MAG: ABC transporter ATP-binding protein [Firmicutes bacterium]|nr:ABC transporter ATP-binding protein [Bacillota bacterium]
MTVIEVKNLIKKYGNLKAVDNLSFSVSKGEIFGMLGPNGAGKSTTFEIIVGILRRDSGDVKVLGVDPEKQPEAVKSRIGVQLQAAQTFRKLTVRETLKLFAGFYPNPLPVDETIAQVDLVEKMNSRVETRSGGQRQRLSVAIAMISNGEIIFLDEPTTGLDPQARRDLWGSIIELKNLGKTVFLTTHFMEEAQKLCDRVAIIDYGKIVALGSPQELITAHFQEMSLEIVQPELRNEPKLRELTSVTEVIELNDLTVLRTPNLTATIQELSALTKTLGIKLDDFRIRQANLEDVFLKLTGRRIKQ